MMLMCLSLSPGCLTPGVGRSWQKLLGNKPGDFYSALDFYSLSPSPPGSWGSAPAQARPCSSLAPAQKWGSCEARPCPR